MKIKIVPIINPMSGEEAHYLEVFDPRVVSSRPAVSAEPPVGNFPGNEALPAFPGTVSCLARFYNQMGNTLGVPVRNDHTALTAEQYAAWTNDIADDEAYFASCVMKNLGLARA